MIIKIRFITITLDFGLMKSDRQRYYFLSSNVEIIENRTHISPRLQNPLSLDD